MSDKKFEPGDQIGRYKITEFWGRDRRTNEPGWWVLNAKGDEVIVSEKEIHAELRRLEREKKLTPEYIESLSAKAYAALLKEVGEDAINRVYRRDSKEFTDIPDARKIEIAQEFFARYPQVERTVDNLKPIAEWCDDHTVTTLDGFIAAFEDLAPRGKLTLDLRVLGISDPKYGWSIVDNYEGIARLSAEDLRKVMSPVVPKHNDDPFASLSAAETKQAFDTADQRAGIERPVPPLLQAARERVLATFFQTHGEVEPTEENVSKMLRFLAESKMQVTVQGLEAAAESLGLACANDSTVRYGGTTLQVNRPRQRAPINPQPSEVQVIDRVKRYTPKQIDEMSADEFREACNNPAFRRAIDEPEKE